MIIERPKEVYKGESRVAMTPESSKQLKNLGYRCLLETGAGLNANFSESSVELSLTRIICNFLWD